MFKTDVIAHFGGVIATAKFLGITRSAVAQWRAVIPERSAWRLQSLTNGSLRVDPHLYVRDPLRAAS
jgi:hypothetical protein